MSKMVWVEGGEMTFKKLIRMWTCKWGMVRFIDLRFWLWFLDNIEELFNLMAWTISNKLLYKLHTAICLSCDPQLNFFFFFYRVFIAGNKTHLFAATLYWTILTLIYLQQPWENWWGWFMRETIQSLCGNNLCSCDPLMRV
jgi:hypothetical protein